MFDFFSSMAGLDEYEPRKCTNGKLGITITQLFMLRNIAILLKSKSPSLLLKQNEEEVIRKQ